MGVFDDAEQELKLPPLPIPPKPISNTTIPAIPVDKSVQVPDFIRGALMVATQPIRDSRGIGVGTQQLIGGQPASKALERAVEATKPGFQPQPGEKIGAFLGENVPIAVATAPFGVIGAASRAVGPLASAGRLALQSGISGASGAGLNAVEQVVDTGKIDPSGVKKAGLFSGISLPVFKVGGNLLGRAFKALTRGAVSSTTSVSRESAETAAKTTGLLSKFKGTAESVGKRVEDVQQALSNIHKKAGEMLGKARAKVGLSNKLEKASAEVAETGELALKPMKELVEEFNAAKAITPKDKTSAYIKLQELDAIKSQIARHVELGKAPGALKQIDSVEEAAFKKLVDSINQEIGKINVPGVKQLKAAESAYSEIRKQYDELLKELNDPAKAEAAVVRMQKAGEDALGKPKLLLKKLEELEKATGKNFIDPLKKELAARDLRNMKAKTISGLPIEVIGPTAVSGALRAGEAASNVVSSFAPYASILGSRILGKQRGKRTENK